MICGTVAKVLNFVLEPEKKTGKTCRKTKWKNNDMKVYQISKRHKPTIQEAQGTLK